MQDQDARSRRVVQLWTAPGRSERRAVHEEKGGVCGFTVENCPESHKPVEISDLRPLSDSWTGGARGPTRRGKAADGPLRAGKGHIASLVAGLD